MCHHNSNYSNLSKTFLENGRIRGSGGRHSTFLRLVWICFAQTGAALRRLVRPCADWCGPAQTGAALRRLVRPCAGVQSANFPFSGSAKVRILIEQERPT